MDDWRTYDGVAETYDLVHGPRVAEPARDLVAIAQPPAGGRLLDVGTGTGVAAAAALEVLGPDGLVVGIDVSLSMLGVGRRSRPRVLLTAAQAIDLPFADDTFDVVVANFVISHFTKYETALFDMIRVLRPGGRLAVSSWGANDDDLQKTWRELVEGVVQEQMLHDALGSAIPWAERFANRAALEETLLDAGLRHVRTEPREYRFQYAIHDYVRGLETWSMGRFTREMLGPEAWDAFRARAREVFSERFANPVNDFRDVWLAVGTKP